MAEWSCSGLQIRVRRFDSGLSLQLFNYKLRSALFLDRDGVINVDHGYVHKIKDFDFNPGIFNLVRKANLKKYLVIVITNQAGIGRGFFSEEDFHNLMDWVLERFKNKKAKVDDIYFCPFHPLYGKGIYKRKSNLRKPNPGMIIEAAKDYDIHLESSIFVGDKLTDIKAGLAAGVGKNILLNPSEDISGLEKKLHIVNELKYVQKFL